MRAMLGEEGTEQFTLDIEYNGRKFPTKPLHDPFITTRIGISRWDLFKGLFCKQFEVRLHLGGTHMVQRSIMTLDPEQLARDEKVWLEEMATARKNHPTIGYTIFP